jgi:hypothetical protein
MKMRNVALVLAAAVFAAFFAAACGGGGGGGQSVNYTGNDQPSVIDTTTAVDVAREVGMQSFGAESYMDTSILPLAVSGGPMLEQLLNPGEAAGVLLDILKREPAPVMMAVQADPLSYQCFSDSGSGYYSGSGYAKICGDYDGEYFTYIDYLKVTFNNYSDDGVAFLDGTMILDSRTSVMKLIFNDFSYHDSSENFFIDGTVNYAEGAGVSTVSYNLFVYDYVLDEGVWLNNVILVEEDFVGYVEDSLNGRFYDFDDGFFEVETIENFVFNDGSDYPSDGTLKITGANGASITVEVVDETGFIVYVDLDGDGSTDWTSSKQPWEPV